MQAKPGESDKVAEVRDALRTLQALTAELEATAETLKGDPPPGTLRRLENGERALVPAGDRALQTRRRAIPIVLALLTAAGVTGAAIALVTLGGGEARFRAPGDTPGLASQEATGIRTAPPATGVASTSGAGAREAGAADSTPVATGARQKPTDDGSAASSDERARVTAVQTVPAARSLAAVAGPPSATQMAKAMLAEGRVVAARGVLLGAGPRANADVAWLLARSYDPRFHETLADRDAEADAEMAAAWYRAWHQTASRQGLVSPGLDVEKLIRAMQ